MKKILIVSTSPRVNSNSEALAKAFAQGVQEAGHEAELISLRGKTVNFCRGCFVCQEKLRCVIRDDADVICRKALEADVLVFATSMPALRERFSWEVSPQQGKTWRTPRWTWHTGWEKKSKAEIRLPFLDNPL